MAASRHTHASCNAVPLVWGSLRLAPIIAFVTHLVLNNMHDFWHHARVLLEMLYCYVI